VAGYSGSEVKGHKATEGCWGDFEREDCACKVTLPHLFHGSTTSLFRQCSVPVVTANIILAAEAPKEVKEAIVALLVAPLSIQAEACVQHTAPEVLEPGHGCMDSEGMLTPS
jgi:hypothetical protein